MDVSGFVTDFCEGGKIFRLRVKNENFLPSERTVGFSRLILIIGCGNPQLYK